MGLTGGGGVGKSALAYHFATVHRYEFPDGVIGLRVDKKDVNTIARQLARMIGHPIHEDDDIEAREIMQRFFAPRRMLLIFDNAEEAKIKVLRPGGNRCAIIVTTRKQNLPVSLDLSETATIRLRSLPENDALDLLRNILGQTEIDNALAAAKRIAEVVGRLPLALQVVGGTLRGKRRSLATYADSLQRQKEQLRLLPRLRLGEDPDLNVVACLNLSLECLQEEEIDFFACLGVCGEDGFALRTAMAAGGCEDEFDAEDFLDKLYEVSLLNSEEVQQDRFVLHPLVREYARSVAQDRNLLSLAQERHAQFFVERLQFDDLEDETVIAEVATDLSDVFLAAEWLQNYWGQTTEKKRKKGYRFVLKLQPLFEHYGYWEQGISLMERLQTWAEQFDDWSTVFQCQIHQGRYWSFVEEFERAEEILISAKDISSDDQKIEDIDTRRKRHAKVLGVLGGVYQKQGKTEKAIETFEAKIEIDESLDDKKSLAIVWNRLGGLLEKQGQFKEAQHAFETEIELAKSLDDKHGLAIGWNCLGGVLEKQEKLKEAEHAFEKTIKNIDFNDKQSLTLSGKRLERVQKKRKLKEAQEALKEQIENAKSLDDQKSLAISWNSLGELLKKERKLDEAQQAFETVINISQNFKDQYFLAAWALHNLGIIYKSKKEFKTAEKFLKESVEIFKDNNYLPGLTKVMNTLGSVLEKQQKWREAKKVLEESYSFAEKLGDELGQAIIANSLGQVMAHLEEDEAHERSFMYFNQSIKLGKKLNNEPHLAKVYTARGKIFCNRGQNERAVEELSQGFEIDVKLGNIRGLRIIIPSITRILSTLGKQEEALAYCERALKVAPNNTTFQELYHKIQRAIANGKRYAKQISVIEEEEDDDW